MKFLSLSNAVVWSGLLIVQSFLFSCQKTENQSVVETNFTQFVNPFIGTGGHGHTYPGPVLPFGAIQLSPDNGTEGWDWCSGYHYSDSVIAGFSHLHLSGTGIGDLADISFMPVDFAARKAANLPDTAHFRSPFSHQNETARPGYYAVTLDQHRVRAELTATEWVGFHRYTFERVDSAGIVVDLGFRINWDSPTATELTVASPQTLSGKRFSTGWSKNQQVYFAARFSHPIKSWQLVGDDGKALANAPTLAGTRTKALLVFDLSDGKPLEAQVALSSANMEGAEAGLSTANGLGFDQAAAQADAAWNKALSVVEVETDNRAQKETFYTALYHSMLAPVRYADALGNYKGADGQIHQNKGRYTVFSLWDTFRAAHPLLTIVRPTLVDTLVQSMMAFYEENKALPVWELTGHETHTMTGYHAVPVLADAWKKGLVKSFTAQQLFEAANVSGMQNIRGTDAYREFGYLPQDKHGWSVTITLEYAFDDWCIAQLAEAAGNAAAAEQYRQRALSYQPLFDPETGFMRAKTSDGKFVAPFDPYYSEHGFEGQYIEGNAWQHSWFVPHDAPGLIALHGGKEPFVRKLDSLFTASSQLTGENVSADISGLIGQYAHGNEPSHHIAYLYNFAGEHAKTQQRVRQICTELYTNQPDGLSGNEDCGQMSAWYVFSAMGFYPVNPASAVYEIGSPLFSKVTIRLPNGKVFTIRADQQAADHPYIQQATWNGKPLAVSSLTHEQILEGGELVLQMGAAPSKLWN